MYIFVLLFASVLRLHASENQPRDVWMTSNGMDSLYRLPSHVGSGRPPLERFVSDSEAFIREERDKIATKKATTVRYVASPSWQGERLGVS